MLKFIQNNREINTVLLAVVLLFDITGFRPSVLIFSIKCKRRR